MRFSSEQVQQNGLELALKALPEGGSAAAEPVADVLRGAGEFCIREGKVKDAQDLPERGEDAADWDESALLRARLASP